MMGAVVLAFNKVVTLVSNRLAVVVQVHLLLKLHERTVKLQMRFFTKVASIRFNNNKKHQSTRSPTSASTALGVVVVVWVLVVVECINEHKITIFPRLLQPLLQCKLLAC